MKTFEQWLAETSASRGRDHPVWKYNDKVSARTLAELADVPHPALYDSNDDIHLLKCPDKPSVIKPTNGCTSRGVALLLPQGKRFLNLMDGRKYTWEQAKSLVLRKYDPKHVSPITPPWLLEEMIMDKSGRNACDWRMYTFGGKVEVTLQTRSTPDGFYAKWWDGEWNHIGEIRPNVKMNYKPTMIAPYHPEELIAAAGRIAKHVDSPFARIDLYDDPERGPMFGELTPHPGNPKYTRPFKEEWGIKLGNAWEAAL